ncbi:hypothetical protein EDB83DRAFT_2372806 [Lactarius deliciosus]|nr:hypothetical protein EDB83DRAFT_2372806 [Lactarius deliciosus]
MTTPTTDAEVFDGSWSATAVFTVSGEPLGSAFLQGNKTWGRLVYLLDPDHDEPEQQKKKTKGKGKMARRGRRGKRIQFFVGSLEPLLVARRRRRRRRSESLMPFGDDGDDGDGDEDGNPGVGGDADADADADDGIWPGEYVVSVPPAQAEEMARITPEEVERAIGAAFAIGTPA